MNTEDKVLCVFILSVFLIATFAIGCVLWDVKLAHELNLEAVKAGLVQRVEKNKVIWVKPDTVQTNKVEQ